MPYIAPKHTGQRITARDWNALRAGAREGSQLIGGDGVETMRGTGAGATIAIAPTSPSIANAVYAINDNANGMVMGQPVQLHQITAPSEYGPYYWHVDFAHTSGRGNLGITREPIASGAAGWVYVEGEALLLVDTDTIPEGAASDAGITFLTVRFGCKKHSYSAIYDRLGPFLNLAAVARAAGLQYAIVQINGCRGDHVVVIDYDENVYHSGPYHTIVFGKGYVLTKDAPGQFSVSV